MGSKLIIALFLARLEVEDPRARRKMYPRAWVRIGTRHKEKWRGAKYISGKYN